MKQIYIALLAVCALLVSPVALYSQEIVTVIDSSITYEFNSPGDSVRFEKQITSTYDSVFTFTSTNKYRWNEGQAEWDNYQENFFFRDSLGNVLSQDDYDWDDTGEKYHSYTRESSVDTLGYIRSTEIFERSGPDDPWVGVRHAIYELDSAGNRIMETYSDWDDQDQGWIPALRYEREYDSKSRPTLSASASWNATEEQWEEYYRERLEYTDYPDGKTASRILYRWDDAGGLWERLSLSIYEYDESDFLIRDIKHMPVESATNDEWRQDRKKEYDYDASGNRILSVDYLNIASYPDVVWRGMGSKTEHTYTPDSQLQLYVRHRWDDTGDFWKFNESDEYLINEYGYKTTRITYEDGGAGADSVLTEKEFFYPSAYYFTFKDVICAGGTYNWEGQEIDAQGSYEESYVSVMGADSVLTLYLTEKPNPGSFSISGATEVERDQEELYRAPVNAALEYHWTVVNGSIVSGEVSNALEVRWEIEGEGEVASWALNQHGCSSDTSYLDVTVGSNGLEDFSTAGIVLFPIPVKEVLQVQSDFHILEIVVMDLNGREVLTARGTSVDLSVLQSGIYLIRLRDLDGQLLGTRKILKE